MFHITLGRPRGAAAEAGLFTGDVYFRELGEGLPSSELKCFDVQFHVGGRTRWHKHDADQLIVVVSGHGVVAAEDEELSVRPGDVVMVPAGELHWHGATDSTEMSHFTVMVPGGATHVDEARA
jgi:quercetin dioxygenase-like cupin family protein